MDKIKEVAIHIPDPPETFRETNHGMTQEGSDVVTTEESLQSVMMKKLTGLPGEPLDGSRYVTIFRLSGWIRENNKELCEPIVVSIGPYHHGKESLQTMEEHKWFTLRAFIARNENNVGIEVYLQAMRSIEAQARQCYSDSVNMSSDDFVMMLLLDGCFMLEWFNKKYHKEYDSLSDVGWASDNIFSDMCLLENQIPLFVIHKLVELTTPNNGTINHNCKDCPMLKLILKATGNQISLSNPFKRPELSCSNIYHFLHLFYLNTVPEFRRETPKEENHKSNILRRFDCFSWSKLFSRKAMASTNMDNIQCVSELRDAGIKFKRKENSRDILDVTFDNGTIELPDLQIEAISARTIWNLAAFEQSQKPRRIPLIMSSYLALMDSLVNTDKDIAILEQSGIVGNFYRNTEDPANFFNQFAKNFRLYPRDNCFHDLCKDIREYSGSTWHRYRARLMQDYFSTPWSIISVVAAGILLVLTFVQTYYSASN